MPGHSLTGLGTASLDTMGGLITLANPQDLPEGASPRCWDVDFIVGSVFQRYGLSSVFTFSGEFAGPNLGGTATVIDSGGTNWSSPNNILGNTGYASSSTGAVSQGSQVPTTASNKSGAHPWTNPAHIFATGVTYATVALVAGAGQVTSNLLLANGLSFSIPATATVVGIQTSIKADCTGVAVGTASLNLQLATNGNPIGSPVNVPLTASPVTSLQGSAGYQWGTVLSSSIVNGSALGIVVQAVVNPTSGTASFSANTLTVTVFYTTAATGNVLQDQTFAFAIPSTAGISGFEVKFNAKSSAATTLIFQLLKNGIVVGNSHVQKLTTSAVNYSLGAANDLWGSTWTYQDVNNTNYGVQITASGSGTSFVQNVQIETFITPSLSNFNYVKTYKQNDAQTYTFALDNSGILYKEDVTNSPGILTVALTDILPGSYAKSATADNAEYIMFSGYVPGNGTVTGPDLTWVGTDRPRVASEVANGSGLQYQPLSQVGPGAPPIFNSSASSTLAVLALTAYSVSTGVASFTYTIGPTVTAGDLYTLAGVSTALNGMVVSVLAAGLSSTTFEASVSAPDDAGGSIIGTATPLTTYSIVSITQPAAVGSWQDLTWGSGPGPSLTSGTIITVYYALSSGPSDPNLQVGTTVEIAGAPFGDGVWTITGVGYALPSSSAGAERWYFTYDIGSANRQHFGGSPPPPGTYQVTLATLTTEQIPGLNEGSQITITGATPSAWNATWTITKALNSALLSITSTEMQSNGTAKYGFTLQSGVAPVTADNALVTIIQTLNGNGIFNLTGTISSVSGAFFYIDGIGTVAIPPVAETGQAQTFGTQFQFDPGASNLGPPPANAIFGNDTGTGVVALSGAASTAIAAGTRQGVVFFITESGYETAPSPPIIFNTLSNTTSISVSQIPVGPPNVIARGIAITEAGQNGVPGANFYVIIEPVTVTVQGQTPVTYTSTIIHDNISTTATFSFTDAVLLNSEEIDVQGNDLFNLIELGSSAWNVAYASRMFYGMQLNKIDNFNNLTFDGGYLPNTGGSNIQPLGWTINTAYPQGSTLLVSTVTGMSLYINDTLAGTQAKMGFYYQTAYQDAYNVAIIQPNTTYSVRVAARNPGGVKTGTLVIELVDFNKNTGFAATPYGSFSVPFSAMSSTIQVFTGTILTAPFVSVGGVSSDLQLAFYIKNMGQGADIEIDRMELFPTLEPYLMAQVYGSYPNSPESIDASGTGGIIDTTSENPQTAFGGFVMHDLLYLLKEKSLYSTQDDPSSEPGGWGLQEVSNKVGTIGINSYDTGEEWAVTACRQGIFGFNGGQPQKLMQEIYQIWDAINWTYGNTICLRNDMPARKMYCAVPMQTPNVWLPFAPVNANPTSPNVILMLNYQGLNDFNELVSSAQMHTTISKIVLSVSNGR